MGLKDHLHLKLKAFRLRRFRIGDGGNKRRESQRTTRKPLWMMPISHGYHVVEDHQSFRSARGGLDEVDSVVVQREQIGELELWLFGVFDGRIGDGITKYIQSHLFDKIVKESQFKIKSKEIMRKAYLGARAKARETQEGDEACKVGSASVMVINGEKLVMANMGDYRAVVCRDGVAHQISTNKLHQSSKRRWIHKFFTVRMLACDSGNAELTKHTKSSELLVATEKVDSDTEFVVIASSGIWKVMNNQEAVSLIRHIEDPQEAAECLTKEASARMSKSCISCIVLRFD
ncbi:hypothetical protein SLA2020_161580 [Shorea laevis]